MIKSWLIIIAFTLILAVIVTRSGDLLLQRIPPYTEGTCLVYRYGGLTKAKVIHNSWGEATSTVNLNVGFMENYTKISFSELRDAPFVQEKCNRSANE